jgi:hypothetical protein
VSELQVSAKLQATGECKDSNKKEEKDAREFKPQKFARLVESSLSHSFPPTIDHSTLPL